jgi:hypothetical protein
VAPNRPLGVLISAGATPNMGWSPVCARGLAFTLRFPRFVSRETLKTLNSSTRKQNKSDLRLLLVALL